MAYRYSTNRLDYEFQQRLTGLVDDTTPELGGSLDLNDNAFVANLTAGESLAINDLCCMNSSGKMVQADASTDAESSRLIGICGEALSLDEVGLFYLRGFVTLFGFAPGDIIYASTTAGSMQNYPPNGSGQIVRVIGYMITHQQIFLDPDRTWIENA